MLSLDSIFFDNTFEFSWEKLIYLWFSRNQSNNKYLRCGLISKVYTGCTYPTARWTAAVCDSMKVRRKTSLIEIELPLYIRACAFGIPVVILDTYQTLVLLYRRRRNFFRIISLTIDFRYDFHHKFSNHIIFYLWNFNLKL